MRNKRIGFVRCLFGHEVHPLKGCQCHSKLFAKLSAQYCHRSAHDRLAATIAIGAVAD
jgi:hypothetical protein